MRCRHIWKHKGAAGGGTKMHIARVPSADVAFYFLLRDAQSTSLNVQQTHLSDGEDGEPGAKVVRQ